MIIGRKNEQALLRQLINAPHAEAEFVAVVGRRRVGKTFLINSVYGEHLAFDLTGSQNGSTPQQLQNFADQLESYIRPFRSIPSPSNWQEAFRLLRQHLQESFKEENAKKVLFFDELPWLAGQKSGFLEALGYFWNSWASRQPGLVLVICGSAASWMIQKVINDRGGLHNRVTRRIFLEPFTLKETEQYLRTLGASFDRYQIVQLYMAFGGIPHYLKEIDPGESVVQNIDRICFSRQGILSDEFERLYPSLFAQADQYFTVVRALADHKMGLSRNKIAELTKMANGGGLTKVIDELVQSGFVSEFFPFGQKKKDKTYRLSDEYSLFFLQFIEQNRYQGGNPWHMLSQSPAYKTWAGYAFEGICLKHISNLKQALGISGVYALSSSFVKKGSAGEEGAQIDLVLDRNDQIINLFEVKFYNKPFPFSKEYAEKIRQKGWVFEAETKTRKQVRWVFVSAFGLAHNEHSLGLIAQSLSLDDLFEG
jgi:uncharacterized protein